MAVIGFELRLRAPHAGGATFGEVGPYERIAGRLEFAVDPLDEANRGIVDLDLAPRDPEGRVRFAADLAVLAPRNPERGNGRLLLDVPNRGRLLASASFNRPGPEAMLDPFVPGDGFLFRRGFTVASVGWQADAGMIGEPLLLHPPHAEQDGRPIRGQAIVELRPFARARTLPLSQLFSRPYPAADVDDPDAFLLVREWEDGPDMVLPRSAWRFAREGEHGLEPSDRHVHLERGFEPGRIYYLVYATEGAPVVGAGLLALRDAATFLRAGGAGAPCPQGFERVYGFGASQSGRLLRHFLWLGLNRDESGRKALDAALIHIAGALRGEFNHRFAQPSVAFTPGFGGRFPFADRPTRDPQGRGTAGLLDAVRRRDAIPRIFHVNSAWEYWRGDAALLHVDPEGRTDLEPDPDARIYAIASTQHVPGLLPQTREFPYTGERARYGFNVVDHSPLLRALLVRLDLWASAGREPPPSRHPRIDDGSAVERESVLARFHALPAVEPLDPERLSRVRAVDLGPEEERGIGRWPAREGAPYPALVSAVDADLNEIAGIRLPDVEVPVATHTGWNPRDPEQGAPALASAFVGFSLFFPSTRAARERSRDPRPSLEERYASRTDYLERARKAALELVAQGYLLEEDLELALENCGRRWDAAQTAGPD